MNCCASFVEPRLRSQYGLKFIEHAARMRFTLLINTISTSVLGSQKIPNEVLSFQLLEALYHGRSQPEAPTHDDKSTLNFEY